MTTKKTRTTPATMTRTGRKSNDWDNDEKDNYDGGDGGGDDGGGVFF